MQPALVLGLAAVDYQPALGELSLRMEIIFGDNLIWEISGEAVPVINVWLTYDVAGDNARSYAIGAVMVLEVPLGSLENSTCGRENLSAPWPCRGCGRADFQLRFCDVTFLLPNGELLPVGGEPHLALRDVLVLVHQGSKPQCPVVGPGDGRGQVGDHHQGVVQLPSLVQVEE